MYFFPKNSDQNLTKILPCVATCRDATTMNVPAKATLALKAATFVQP
jgi:hypothetical protein